MSDFKNRMIKEMKIRGLLDSTVKVYLKSISQFNKHCCKPLDQVDIQDIKDYQYYLLKERRRKLSPRSVNRDISGIKFFYRYVLGRYDVQDAIPRVKAAQIVTPILSVDEIKSMIESVHKVHYKAILMTMYSCGLRRKELQRLTIQDIDSKRMLLRVNGKNNKQRYVVLSPMLLKVLRTYWRLFRVNSEIKSDYLFIPSKIHPHSEAGKYLSHTAISYVLQTAVKAANIKKK